MTTITKSTERSIERDRPYWRLLTVPWASEYKIDEILKDITHRKDMGGMVSIDDRKMTTCYRVKLKRQELMLIQLSVPGVTYEKCNKNLTKHT